jgi:hypothetical protein
MTTREQLQETICDRVFWHLAERDDAKVAEYLCHRREMDVVYGMDEATLFDSLFTYLQEIEVFPLFDHLDPHTQQRNNVSFIQLVPVSF